MHHGIPKSIIISIIALFLSLSSLSAAPVQEAPPPSGDRPSALPDTASRAVFAGGCFWGMEYYMEKLDGVFEVVSGYTGGHLENPSYRDVLSHTSGHVEAVEVIYDPGKVSYEQLARVFFEIHDPTQTDGQGPDIGEQYLSVLFYGSDEELQTAEYLISILEDEGFAVATTLEPKAVFWPAEEYHQDYYQRKGSLPYCHGYVKRFPD